MGINVNQKGRRFLVAGMFSLAAASTALTRYHYDFAAGFGYAFGIGAVLIGIIFLRRSQANATPGA